MSIDFSLKNYCCCSEKTEEPTKEPEKILENQNNNNNVLKVEEFSVSSFRSYSSQNEDSSKKIGENVIVHILKKEETVESLPSYTENPT